MEKIGIKVLLIVGDDDYRDFITESLAASGFEVTSYILELATYPGGLLNILKKEHFDIIIATNLGIPFRYVPEQVEMAREHARDAGIIVISGYVEDDFVGKLSRIPRSAFIKVPFDLQVLNAKVREIAEKEETEQN